MPEVISDLTRHDLRLGHTRVPTGKKMACGGSTGLLEGVANRPRNNPFFQELGTAARGLMRVCVAISCFIAYDLLGTYVSK